MDSYTTIKHESIFEFEDRKSKFIAEAAPVTTEREALDFIEKVRKKFPDATHHVYAYVIRENSIMRFTDDREPQGTAGMPVLDAIRKNNCTNTVIVVTRYFGGTLLGTGGLVHAYSSSAIGALKIAEVITYETYIRYSMSIGYADYQKIGTVLRDNSFRVEETNYKEDIEIIGKVKEADSSKLLYELIQITSARIKIEKICEIFDF